MLPYILRRLLAMIPLLIVITAFVFIIGQYGTGDLAAYLTLSQSGGKLDPALYASYRAQLHLDDPIFVRYASWLFSAIQGDLGVSYASNGQPSVTHLIAESLPISMQIGFAALILVLVFGVFLGVISALFKNTFIDYAIIGIVTILSSVPLFVLAPLALYFLVIQLHIVPTVGIGWHGLFSQESIMPVTILAANSCLTTVRFTRASVLEVLGQEYIRAAYAKGFSTWKVITKHILKNALIPVISVTGLTASHLLGGSLFLELVFNIQGFGLLAYNSLQAGDLQALTGIILVTAILIILINLLTDLLYKWADPKVKFSS
jgi:ABC-type dipeptide/oligopeptide/nickel transport system permease component